jgi:NADH:ubiquinone oxidoreductase subunit 4 (subunit M)
LLAGIRIFSISRITKKIYKEYLYNDKVMGFLVFLTIWLIIFSLLAMPYKLYQRGKLLWQVVKILGLVLVFSFLVKKLFFFFIFFEISLLPTFFLILG